MGSPLPESSASHSSWWRRHAAHPGTTALISIFVIVQVLCSLQGDTTNGPDLLRFGADERWHVWSGEYWRLLTSAFLHVGWTHLAWNVVMLPWWAHPIEDRVGPGGLLTIFLLGAVTASAFSLLGHDALSAGSSGGGFALVGAWLASRARDWPSWSRPPAPDRRIVVMTALWFGLGAVLRFDNWAHLGGLLFGVAWTWAAEPREHAPRRRARVLVAAATIWVLACVHLPWLDSQMAILNDLHRAGADVAAMSALLPRAEKVSPMVTRTIRVHRAWTLRDWTAVVAETEAGPDTPEWTLARGEALVQLARYDEALTVLDEAALALPKDARVQYLRGWLYQRKGDLATARAVYEDGLLREQATPERRQEVLRAAGLFTDVPIENVGP